MHIELLLTGNEIMSGDTVDTNSARIAHKLAELGLTISRKVTVGDDRRLLHNEIKEMSSKADLIIMNGGLGPTVDDLTAEVVSKVANLELVENPEAMEHLQQWCARRNIPVNAANYKQALLPEHSEILPNNVGSAVGFTTKIGKCILICTPGVPGELSPMLDFVISKLAKKIANSGAQTLRLQTFGIGESAAQQLIVDEIKNWPDRVKLGFRASLPQLEVKLSISHEQDLPILLDCKKQIYKLLDEHIVGEGDARLANEVITLLRKEKATLTTAESCTGGLIASMLTKEPGVSKAFHGGFVTYSDVMKKNLLNVSEDTLKFDGAVSESAVQEMAENALMLSCAKFVIAVSGIAGPDGGTAEKPVGTVWFCWGTQDDLRTCQLLWPVERTLFQTLVAASGLDLIRRHIKKINSLPSYLQTKLVSK